MSNKANPMVIGGFVLGALTLMVVAILVFSTGALFRRADHLVSYFPGTVQGLRVGAPVEQHVLDAGPQLGRRPHEIGESAALLQLIRQEAFRLVASIVTAERDDAFDVGARRGRFPAQHRLASCCQGRTQD